MTDINQPVKGTMKKTNKKDKFERIIKTRPPFDKRSSDPCKNYGIGAMNLWFILKGKKGAVQVMLGTKLYLAKQNREWKAKGDSYPYSNEDDECLDCWDVGYHAWKPIREWQDKEDTQPCDLSPTGKCYYDGSSLRGQDDKVVKGYLEEGDEFIWKYLEDYYKQTFEQEIKK